MKLPENKTRSEEAVTSFIDQLSSADALFEVIVGQGRLLTLKESLTAEGEDSAVIAIGDPNVADFAILGPRHIRVMGRRIGCTDLSIIRA